MRKYFLLITSVILLETTAKQVTIIGPAAAAFNGGKLCVSYARGREVIQRTCTAIQAGKTYMFSLPDEASHVIVERSYATHCAVAHGRFRICNDCNVLDLDIIGCRLEPTKHPCKYPDTPVQPLRTGLVYGWTWR